MIRCNSLLASFVVILTIGSLATLPSSTMRILNGTAHNASGSFQSVAAISPFSWNPRVTCTPLLVRITDITANQTGLASYSVSSFTPGITTTVSGGDAKRWLTPGSTPPGWVSPGPSCSVTNSKGATSLFVEIDGVERGSVTTEDSATTYDPTNGGTAHPTTYDNTFNIFDPSLVPNYDNSCTSTTDPTCYARIHLEIDHDWMAAGYCGTGTFCDPAALSTQTSRNSTKIDFQGFVYWDPNNLDSKYHQFNGWELHPLTGWKLSSTPAPTSLSVNFASSPSVPQVGQTVSFNANVSGGTPPFNFNWNFGDGVVASGNGVSHIYLAANQFTIAVTATDAQGKSASAVKVIDVGSWNSAADCVPAQTRLERVIGNVSIQRIITNPNSTGADYSGGGFRLDGNLTYGSNPTTWPYFKRDLHMPCSIGGTPTLVEFHNVTVTDVNISDCSTTFFADNGGGPYPNGWQSCDTTFNLVTPGFGDSSTCPQCYVHRIYAGIDRDWNASGVAPQHAPVEGERVDVQGFVYWNNVFVNASWHSYSGWEIHPLTAWRPTRASVAASMSFSPSNPTPGQTISFYATVSGGVGPYSFTWDFGDGTLATGNPVTHAYGSGSFLVHLAATDSLGTVGITSKTVSVVVIQNFKLSASRLSLIVQPGKTNTSDIILTGINGFSGIVSLSTSVLPVGPSASLSATTVTLGANGLGSSVLTMSAAPSTLPGTYDVAVTGKSGSLLTTVHVSVTVPGFALSAAPTSLVILAGSFGTDSITVASIGGFHGNINLGTAGAPGGVQLSLNPTSITLSPGGTAASVFKVSTSANSLTGNYTITVKGDCCGTTRTVSISLRITSDFTVSANPPSLSLTAGTSKTTKIIVKSFGFKGTVTLSATVSGPGLTAVISPTSFSFNPGESHDATLTVTSNNAGTYTVAVLASAGSVTHSVQVPVAVTDFALSADPASITLTAASTGSSTITLTSLDGFAGTINLADTVTPTALHVTLSPTSVVLAAGGTASAVLTISSTSTTPPGTYTIVVKGTSGSLLHTVTIVITLTAP